MIQELWLVFYEDTKDIYLPFLVYLGYLTKCSRYGVVKNVPSYPLIYKEHWNPEGQRFKSSPRNQLADFITFSVKIFLDSILFYDFLK